MQLEVSATEDTADTTLHSPNTDFGTTPAPAIDGVVEAVGLLRAVSHVSRLTILCHLMTREHTVSELERLLGERQSAVSQHLSRLRADGLVTYRRQGKTLHYSISDPKTASLVTHLHELFCPDLR